jgi:uncharacterized protein YukE
MVSTGEYEVQPEAIRSTVGNVGGIIMQAVNAVMELEAMVVAPTSFAAIGASVASANTAMQGQQVSTLKTMLSLLQQVNNLVKLSADGYEQADQAVSVSYGGNPSSTPVPGSGLWSSSSSAGSQVAAAAAGSGAGPGSPHAVGNVVGYLDTAGIAQSGAHVPTDSPVDFSNWLAGNPDNQAQLGVLGVYSGSARGFGDIPGGLKAGDLVVIDPGGSAADQQAIIGVVANNSQLYNNGLLQPDFGGVANVQVYRPLAIPMLT